MLRIRSNLARLASFLYTRRVSLSSLSGYFDIQKETPGIAIVTLDDKNAKLNTLSTAMLGDFRTMMKTLESDASIEAVIFVSAKKDNFIAGADISELAKIESAKDGEIISKNGQESLNMLENSDITFIAAIDGSCMGGGLEFALACDYRLASSNKKTLLALPEVKLGLLPGAGGTQRLPKLIGLENALSFITSGKSYSAEQARKLGLVDEVPDPVALKTAALFAAKRLIQAKSGGRKYKKQVKFSIRRFLLERNPLGRLLLFEQASKLALRETLGNYPAVPLIIQTIREGAQNGFAAGLKAEQENFGKLCISSESKALTRIFFATNNLRKNRFESPELKNKYSSLEEKVGILGAGLMGAGIAQVTAEAGLQVIVKDLKLNYLKKGELQIQKSLKEKEAKRRISKYEVDSILNNVEFLASEFHGDELVNKRLSSCNYIFEAVLEDLPLKHKVLADLEPVLKKDCVIASNSSALRISEIARALKNSERLIGMHYFSPVDKMPLLEIIPHSQTSTEVKYKALKLGILQKKTCIVVKDVPGFFVNRCLGPYLSEVTELIKEGVELNLIDTYMKKYGFPVGPVSLIDEVGIDVALHVQKSLIQDIGKRMSDVSLLEQLFRKGNLGRKANKGFYLYDKNKKNSSKIVSIEAKEIISSIRKASNLGTSNKTEISDDKLHELQERMAFKYINEALICFQDGVIESTQDGDIGSVFGVGFPPFRGGPFSEFDRIGAQNFVDKMKKLTEKYGSRFEPAQIALDFAYKNKRFHSN